MNLFGQKYIGPLDYANVKAVGFCINMLRMEILNKMVEEIENCNNILENENTPKAEKILATMLKNQLDLQLEDFLGISNNGRKTKINKVSKQKI